MIFSSLPKKQKKGDPNGYSRFQTQALVDNIMLSAD